MKRSFRFVFSSFAMLSIGLLSSCATTAPSDVPVFEPGEIPAISLIKIEKKPISVSVKVTRTVNEVAKNVKDVEASMTAALRTAVEKGGHTVGGTTHKLNVEVADCPDKKENTECVRMIVNFNSPAGKLRFWTEGHQGYYRGNSSNSVFGDVSEAYSHCIKITIDELNKSWKQLINEGSI